MHRRTVLATIPSVAGIGVVTGCLSTDDNPGAGTGSTPGETATSTAPQTTSRQTTDRLPEDCQPPPDIEGLPDPPQTRSADSVTTYVREFEQTYAAATTDEDEELVSLTVEHVSTESGVYTVELLGETAVTTQPTTGEQTPTERPVDAREYRVQYLVGENRLVRERRGIAGGTVISQNCWTIPNTS